MKSSVCVLLLSFALIGFCHGSNTPLHVAACWERTAAASKLLSSGVVDVNCTSSNGSAALHLAARTNDRAMVKLLLAAGANPNAENLGMVLFPAVTVCLTL